MKKLTSYALMGLATAGVMMGAMSGVAEASTFDDKTGTLKIFNSPSEGTGKYDWQGGWGVKSGVAIARYFAPKSGSLVNNKTLKIKFDKTDKTSIEEKIKNSLETLKRFNKSILAHNMRNVRIVSIDVAGENAKIGKATFDEILSLYEGDTKGVVEVSLENGGEIDLSEMQTDVLDGTSPNFKIGKLKAKKIKVKTEGQAEALTRMGGAVQAEEEIEVEQLPAIILMTHPLNIINMDYLRVPMASWNNQRRVVARQKLYVKPSSLPKVLRGKGLTYKNVLTGYDIEVQNAAGEKINDFGGKKVKIALNMDEVMRNLIKQGGGCICIIFTTVKRKKLTMSIMRFRMVRSIK